MRGGLIVFCLALLSLFCQPDHIYAGARVSKGKLPAKLGINSLTTTLMDANNLTSWIIGDEFGLNWPPVVNNAFNGSYPKGDNAGFIFQDGIVFGGIVRDGAQPMLRIHGNTYSSDMASGSIMEDSNGNVIGSDDVQRIWRVRPDYKTADLTDDAACFFQEPDSLVTQFQIDSVRSWYARDWDEWPASKGAPFVDANGDGKYEPSIDVPGIEGATQTIWTVANDLKTDVYSSLFDCPPIGIEEQVTEWTWNGYPQLENVIYRQVKLIYKGTPTTPPGSYIDSMYISQWSDVDDGFYGDDYAGCDSAESLGYVYNGEPYDSVYSPLGLVPPAGGYEMINGTAYKTGNLSDSAIVDLQWRRGYRYWYATPMTSFVALWSGTATVVDPSWGTYDGALEIYNYFRFALPHPEYPGYMPIWAAMPGPYNKPTDHMLSGDPTTQSGWVDGIVAKAAARSIICNHGPIRLSLGDTVELTIASVGADSSNYIDNVSELKSYGQFACYAFQASSIPSGTSSIDAHNPKPSSWGLSQNYPNPFNPTTAIRFEVQSSGFVSLKVYDVLGRVVATLMDEAKMAGSYEVHFDGSKLASGIYFYRLVEGSRVITKKMLLVK